MIKFEYLGKDLLNLGRRENMIITEVDRILEIERLRSENMYLKAKLKEEESKAKLYYNIHLETCRQDAELFKNLVKGKGKE